MDTSRFSRGDVMCDAHQKLPSEAHLEHSALEVGDYCSQATTSLGPSDCAFCLKKQGDSLESSLWLFEISFSPRCRCERETSKEPKTVRPALCSFVFFSSD